MTIKKKSSFDLDLEERKNYVYAILVLFVLESFMGIERGSMYMHITPNKRERDSIEKSSQLTESSTWCDPKLSNGLNCYVIII
jgi:hypothetical protein